ncbi:MAG: lipoate--protein ligase family protein [Candidatus Rokubacteria bacterium]|nr:lipoate--protein ligase family protein [Candidatus Rokubacteria bacterium]
MSHGASAGTSWRYVADDGVTASFGLAADEGVTWRQGTGDSPPTVRLYTYRSHCALVGRFQRVAAEVRLDVCRERGIAVNRRPTGGGAILMGRDQLGVAVMTPARAIERSWDRIRELFRHFGAGVVDALERLGIRAEYRRKNDIEVGGKKIAGLGIFFDRRGGLLFHASLLVDLDVPLMLSVLRTPFEKISDKEVATVASRTTTVRRECGRAVSVDEVRALVHQGYARTLGVELPQGDFTTAERNEIQALERDRYLTAGWIEREPATPDAAGSATVKTPGGLLSAHLTLAGDVIKAIYLTGDFFCDETVVSAIERGLRWHAAEPAGITATLESLEGQGLGLPQIGAGDVARVIGLAADAARRHEQAAVAKGCFVNP